MGTRLKACATACAMIIASAGAAWAQDSTELNGWEDPSFRPYHSDDRYRDTPPECNAAWQTTTWTENGWVCSQLSSNLDELTAGRLCRSDGVSIRCDSQAPTISGNSLGSIANIGATGTIRTSGQVRGGSLRSDGGLSVASSASIGGSASVGAP